MIKPLRISKGIQRTVLGSSLASQLALGLRENHGPNPLILRGSLSPAVGHIYADGDDDFKITRIFSYEQTPK